METELPQYIFEALCRPEDIRVLEILGTTPRIECKLRQTKAIECTYQALSYVWGSEEKPFKAVICGDDGKALGWLPLTTTLQDALYSLRDCSELKGEVFWIDQICINQEDNGEKSHQVRIMGDIYKNASRVIVYIGPAGEPEEEKAGIELMHQVTKTFQGSYSLLHSYGDLQRVVQNKEQLIPASGIPPELQSDETLTPEQQEDRYVSQGWRWLCSVIYGKWNRRLWMIQEQLLSREIIMLRGLRLLPWDCIAMIPVLFFLHLLPWSYFYQFWVKNGADYKHLPDDIIDAVYELFRTRREWEKRWSEGMPFIDSPARSYLLPNLSSYQDLECRDLRDRIYALLAISEDAQQLAIAPDYSQDYKTVSIQTSVAILRQYQNLTLLVLACRWANSDTTFPSWALNLSHHSSPGDLPYNMLAAHPQYFKQYNPRFITNNSTLLVRGSILDHISTHAFPISYTLSYSISAFDEAWLQTATQILESWSSILLHFGVTAENTVRLCQAIMVEEVDWTSSAHDQHSPQEQMIFCIWSEYRRLFYEANCIASESDAKIENRHRLESTFYQLTTLLKRRGDTDTTKPSDPLTDDEEQNVQDFSKYFLVRGRSYSITEQNRICSAMHGVQPGDAVAAFKAADRLYIIRPVGDKFRLVGDAFIPGLNFGEAYEGLNPDEVDHDIELI